MDAYGLLLLTHVRGKKCTPQEAFALLMMWMHYFNGVGGFATFDDYLRSQSRFGHYLRMVPWTGYNLLGTATCCVYGMICLSPSSSTCSTRTSCARPITFPTEPRS